MRHSSLLRSSRSVLAVILLLAAPLLAFAVDRGALEKRFAEANAKTDAGEFQQALEIYNSILEEEPDAGNAWVMRAIAKWNLKDRSGARADIAQAIKLHPDFAEAFRIRGQFRYQVEDYPASLADFSKAIELADEPNAELFAMRAEVRRKLSDLPAAISDLTRAIELQPEYAAALFLRGELHEDSGDAAAAEADYSQTLVLEPKHAGALNSRAWIRFHKLAWDEASADAKRALELAPQASDARRLLGYAEFARGEYANAARTLAAAADADATPQSAYALFVRYYALLRAGATDRRLATAWGAWKEEPWLQAIARFITGEIDEEALEAAAKETSDDGELMGRACELHFYIGLARAQAGDKSTARLRFQSAVTTEQTTFIEYSLARAELNRGKK